MNLWTEEEFQRVALRTKIAERTLDACREVLVEGAEVVQAAERHKMFPAQISRANKTLREKQEHMLDAAQVSDIGTEIMKLTAIQVAKNIMGQRVSVNEAQPGHTYEGPVLVNTQGFVVQKVGRSAVIYDLGKFKEAPPLNEPVAITVPAHGGKVRVATEPAAPVRAKGLSR